MTTIQIRIDEKTKAKARKVFGKMGLDVSSGIKLYLTRVAQDESIPFVVRTENGYTPEQEAQIIRETEWAEKHGKRYNSVGEIMQEFFPDYKRKKKLGSTKSFQSKLLRFNLIVIRGSSVIAKHSDRPSGPINTIVPMR